MDRTRQKLNPRKIMASNDEILNINSLPDEMLMNIFSHLSQNELGRIARVCRRWNVLTKDPALWKEVNVEFHKSHNSQNTVAKCFFKMSLPRVTCIRLDFRHFCRWSGQLNWEEFCVTLQKICPHLERLILLGAVLSNSLPSVIDLCTLFLPDVKILTFNYSSFNNCSVRGELNGSSKIEVLGLSWSCLGYFSEPSFSKMPHLKQLHLFNTNINDYWFKKDLSFLSQLHVLNVGYTHISSTDFSAIRCYGFKLKELFLCNLVLRDDELKFNNSVFPHMKTICLRGCSTVTCEAVVSLIQSCPLLQNLYVDQKVAASYAAHPFIVANRCKFEIVKVIPDCNEHQRIAY